MVFSQGHHSIPHIPRDFQIQPALQSHVVAATKAQFYCHPDRLIPYPAKGNLFISSASPPFPSEPCYLVMHFDEVFNSNANQQVIKVWNPLSKLHPKVSPGRQTRDPTSQRHLGIWEHYSQHPRVTSESLSQDPATLKILDGFLFVFKEEILSPLYRLLLHYDQPYLHRQEL